MKHPSTPPVPSPGKVYDLPITPIRIARTCQSDKHHQRGHSEQQYERMLSPAGLGNSRIRGRESSAKSWWDQ